MNSELIAALAGLGGLCVGSAINFVINVSVKMGKLETRVDTAERDLNNIGRMLRKTNEQHRRVA